MKTTEWTEHYVFILPSFSANPMCLLCNRPVSVCKEYNLRRHHDTEHSRFKVSFPPKSTDFCHVIKRAPPAARSAAFIHSQHGDIG